MLYRMCPERNSVPSPLPPALSATSWRSWVGLCAACFFLAEVNGVTMPFVNTYLIERGWRYDAIGAAASFAGLVSLLTHSPGGFLIDHTRRRRVLLAGASLLVGACFGILPLAAADRIWVVALLAVAAVAKPLFGPLTNALTLDLVGHTGLNRAMGVNQGWNHAGNIAAALIAMVLVGYFPVAVVFFAVAAASVLAALSVFLIRTDELDRSTHARSVPFSGQSAAGFRELLRDRRVAVFLASATLFHLANAPVMPLVAQKIKHVGGSDGQVAGVVLTAQAVMVPVALLAGLVGECWGRKPVLAVGFAVLPFRIALYAFADNPSALVALQRWTASAQECSA